MERKCLFIDDDPDDVKSVLENLTYKGKLKGLDINCQLLGLTRAFYQDNGDLDRNKIETALHSQFMDNHTYDLVACDFGLEDEKLTGLDMVTLVRLKSRNCAIVLYSGNLEKIANYIAERETLKDRYRKIRSIVNGRITEFIDRGKDYEEQLIHIMMEKIPIEVTIEKKLQEHGDFKFKHGYEKFIGKSLKEIAREIKIGSPHGNTFKNEIIERGIAHMIELNSRE